MKEELKQKMIGVIGSYNNSLIESIAEQCAQVAVDFYKEREQALDTSSVVERSEQLFCPNCHTFHNNKRVDGYCCKSCWEGIEAK